MNDRHIYQITGADRFDFLQGLVTNDIRPDSGLTYAALLTPQGKYLADFFLLPMDDYILLDVHADLAPSLLQRLTMYKLRADVQITDAALKLERGIDNPPADAYADPRHPALGWRRYTDAPGSEPSVNWDAIRVEHCIPETGIELTPDTYILEAGFERLNGVDFKKGCFVGQEIVARMHHKTTLQKGLRKVRVRGDAAVGDQITSNEKPAGQLFTQSDGQGIAFLRFNRTENMKAGEATLELI
ncbi:YgfZ/GcvT domain-containing protein [Pseudaestuariivita rosea]|uniref:CAF17-like 4Fe-4S cluster assembly/insertion protein YgfZ n=1 Tax=Pseudaestuariivita rosea TaxID=2763263 RepID=UPI001ABB877F|nr:folate-binding protein YgfZ [Pseudaestuariivita rosea]